jgi:23S rRNA U2552 (ribose-2'-O)-methylase RlmE/FtsJ
MSWLSDSPPWSNVKWFEWGDPHKVLWTEGPEIKTITSDIQPTQNSELYVLKGQIEELDALGEWEFLKRSSNPYELVFSQSNDIRIPGPVSSLKPLSRSFFKMIEILSILDFFKRHPLIKPHQSGHVCEGPGGFIEALLYISEKEEFKFSAATAMTLKPVKSNIPGWKRAYNFLRKSPMVKIIYGEDGTGDITVVENQQSFLEKCRGKCSIFTADGGFDFSEHYSKQEVEVFPLLVSSSIIGLQTMKMGGDFVLKLFDTELKCTKNLIAILAYCFNNWTLYKPGLSRPCNAEKYFIGRGCRVVPSWILKTLNEIRDLTQENSCHIESIFSILPAQIELDIQTLEKEYLEQQIAALKHAINNKEEWNRNPKHIWSHIHTRSINWCKHFKIPIKPFTSFYSFSQNFNFRQTN